MSIGFENQPTFDSSEHDSVSYELLTYTFGYMPSEGGTVSLEQITEDLEEAPDTILAAMQELRSDRFLNYTLDKDVITVTYKDEEFLKTYSVYQAITRDR